MGHWNTHHSYGWDYMYQLKYLSLDKMVANLADDIFKCISFNETVWIAIQI